MFLYSANVDAWLHFTRVNKARKYATGRVNFSSFSPLVSNRSTDFNAILDDRSKFTAFQNVIRYSLLRANPPYAKLLTYMIKVLIKCVAYNLPIFLFIYVLLIFLTSIMYEKKRRQIERERQKKRNIFYSLFKFIKSYVSKSYT